MEPGPDRSSASASTPDGPTGRRPRARRWLLTHGLHVETLLALLILVMIPVTVIVMAFGAVVAFPGGGPPEGGESGTFVLYGVLALIDGVLWLAVGLGVFVLVHGAVEVRTAVRTDFGRGRGDGMDLAYAAVRTVRTVAAVAFVGGVLVEGPLVGLEATSLTISANSGLLLLASVFAHAAGRAVRSMARVVRSQ